MAAVGLGFSLGAQHPQVGATVRLGQAHGAGPFATGQPRQVGGLLSFGAMFLEAFVGAMLQAGVHGPGPVSYNHLRAHETVLELV